MKISNLFIIGKKADGFRMLNYGFWRILFISILFLVMFLVVATQIKTEVDVSEISAYIFYHRVINTESSYQSPYTNRYYPGNIGELNDGIFIEEFDTDRIGAKLTIRNENIFREVYINKKWFDRYYPLGSFERYSDDYKLRYILIDGEVGLLEYRSVEKD